MDSWNIAAEVAVNPSTGDVFTIASTYTGEFAIYLTKYDEFSSFVTPVQVSMVDWAAPYGLSVSWSTGDLVALDWNINTDQFDGLYAIPGGAPGAARKLISRSLVYPVRTAVDTNGTIFVIDCGATFATNCTHILRFENGVSHGVPIGDSSSFTFLFDIAVSGSFDIFVIDQVPGGALFKIPGGKGSATLLIHAPIYLSLQPIAVAISRVAGNVFVLFDGATNIKDNIVVFYGGSGQPVACGQVYGGARLYDLSVSC